jgi:secondary thiamine-phosphate synthase enzyme
VAHLAKSFSIVTKNHNEVVDITEQVGHAVAESGVRDGQLVVYTPHATAAITVNENDDPNIGGDFLRALQKMVPEHDGWLHDRIDNNAAAHIKSALVGPSVVIPLIDGRLALGTWQNVFFCEFDGPRRERRIVVSIAY